MPPEKEGSNPQQDDRTGARLRERMTEVERVMKAILEGIQELEDVIGEPIMKKGVYFGIKFDD